MTDTSRRSHERTARTTGDPADQARALLEDLRAGRLDLTRLELAAYAGHEPARLCLGEGAWLRPRDHDPFLVPSDLVVLPNWVVGLRRWSKAPFYASFRAVIVAAELCLSIDGRDVAAEVSSENHQAAARALQTAKTILREPGEYNRWACASTYANWHAGMAYLPAFVAAYLGSHINDLDYPGVSADREIRHAMFAAGEIINHEHLRDSIRACLVELALDGL